MKLIAEYQREDIGPPSDVKRNFWPIIVSQLFCLSE